MRRLVVLTVTLGISLGLVAAPAGAHGAGPGPKHRFGPVVAPDRTGPNAVGRTTFEVVDPDREGRTLPVDVWYPARHRDVAGLAKSPIDLLLTQIDSPLAYDNPPVAAGRELPLVVFSHGSGGVRYQSWFLMEHLASHGFVVAAPDHIGNSALDGLFGTQTPFAVSARNRPLDVSLVITRMLERNASPGDAFAHRLAPDRIAVMGHSFGGFTAVAAATGWQDVPADPRVKAIIPIAAATNSFSDEQLRAVDRPSLWLHGTTDATVDLAQTERAWSLLEASPRYRVDIIRGGHSSFTNSCELLWYLAGVGLPGDLLGFLVESANETCGPDLVPVGTAWSVTKATTLAFLETTLEHDWSSLRFLRPGYLRQFPVTLSRG